MQGGWGRCVCVYFFWLWVGWWQVGHHLGFDTLGLIYVPPKAAAAAPSYMAKAGQHTGNLIKSCTDTRTNTSSVQDIMNVSPSKNLFRRCVVHLVVSRTVSLNRFSLNTKTRLTISDSNSITITWCWSSSCVRSNIHLTAVVCTNLQWNA